MIRIMIVAVVVANSVVYAMNTKLGIHMSVRRSP